MLNVGQNWNTDGDQKYVLYIHFECSWISIPTFVTILQSLYCY